MKDGNGEYVDPYVDPKKVYVQYDPPAIDAMLDERGKRYGAFKGHAEISQRLKHEMAICGNWNKLLPDQREALEMIVHKVARILNGDPNYADSWADIAGYAKLVADRLEGIVR